MKLRWVILIVLTSALAFAQTETPQTPPAGAQGQTGAGAATAPRRTGRTGAGMSQIHQQMQAQIDRFNTMLDKMKTDAAAIQDSAGKQVAQDNIDMWQALIDHMKSMAGGMGAARGMNMEHMHGMGGKTGSTPPKTPPTPK